MAAAGVGVKRAGGFVLGKGVPQTPSKKAPKVAALTIDDGVLPPLPPSALEHFAAECDDWVAPRAAFLVKPLDLEDCESVGSLGPPQRLPHDDSRVLGGAPQVRILFGNPLGLEGFEPSRLAIGRLGGDRHRDSRSGAG